MKKYIICGCRLHFDVKKSPQILSCVYYKMYAKCKTIFCS